ncbi:MAG TPA: tyrosine--tRNA ligase [Chloroflexia bacterium]|nr:tyrosine--tRNA ligase [Chloroflexia bacterium]
MDESHVTGPAELRSELRETRREIEAEAIAASEEADAELEAEATVRSELREEEAERWGGDVNTDDAAIEAVLSRAVVDVIVRDELRDKLKSGRKLRVKLGIDPTGPMLHLGRSVPLLKLRQFQEMGHQIVLIIGDFTAIVGDASDKDAQRVMLSREQIEANMATYRQQVGHILDLDKVEFRYNSQWLQPLNFNDVVRLASKFTVAQMIQRENFSDRWDAGKPIGLHEIMYPLMQGFDSVAINADVEIGGTDQLFNLMSGRALQEDFDQAPQSVMTINMIPGTDGRKMSTSWGNTIYMLDDPTNQFGKIMSAGDEVITLYMESCTLLPIEEVRRVEAEMNEGSLNPINAKKRLAWEIVSMYHGVAAANEAQHAFEQQFQNRDVPTQIPIVPVEKALGDKANEKGEIGILDLLIHTGLAPNRKQAQRLVEQGGVRIGEERITDREYRVELDDGMIIKAGRGYVKIED